MLIPNCFCSLKRALKGKHHKRLPVEENIKLNENYYQPEQIHISYGCNLNSSRNNHLSTKIFYYFSNTKSNDDHLGHAWSSK